MLDLAALASLYDKYKEEFIQPIATFSLGSQNFDFQNHAYLMGVINLSADSWYRESVALNTEAAIRRGKVLHEMGASIIDIGAESTLEWASLIDGKTQNSLLVPVVKELASIGYCISVETYHPNVTSACLKAGAQIINLTGTTNTQEIYQEIADFNAGVIICFVEGNNVRDVKDLNLTEDPIQSLHDFFAHQIEMATKAGISRIWIDPGLGFYYKNLQDSAIRIRHQMSIFLNSFRLRKLGWPICQALPHAFECFEEDVRDAESFFAVLALLGKVNLLRTHEVSKVKGVLRTMNLMKQSSDLIK